MPSHINKKFRYIIVFTLFFIGIYLFFSTAHPLTLLDTDDWAYIYKKRPIWPSRGQFNPSRILPEVFMPFVSHMAYAVFHGSLDFIDSLTLGYNITVSLFVAVYCVMAYCLLRKHAEGISSYILSVVFLLMHFEIYKIGGDGLSYYAFFAPNVTCFFYYTIPALLNLSLVFWIIVDDRCINVSKDNILRNIVFLILAYFAVYSNMWASDILVIFLGIDVLMQFLLEIDRNKKGLKDLCVNHSMHFLVIVLWGISLWFETQGGRASQVGSATTDFWDYLWKTITRLNQTGLNNFIAIALIILTVSAGIYLYKINGDLTVLKLDVTILLIMIFNVLLSAKTSPGYILRSDVLLGTVGLLLITSLISLYCILERVNGKFVLPVLIVLLIVIIATVNSDGKTYRDSNVIANSYYAGDFAGSRCKDLDDDIVDQVINASEQGLTEVVITIPEFPTSDNWPLADYAENRVADALYDFGIIETRLTSSFAKDTAKDYFWK